MSLEQVEELNGGMSQGCAMALIGVGFAAVSLGALTGGIGFYGVVSLASAGMSGVGFMYSCGPSDFKKTTVSYYWGTIAIVPQ